MCLHLTLAETVFARLTSFARVKLAQCKQNLALPWLGHGQGASVNRVNVWNCNYGDMHLKDLGSIARVGYCIPVPDFYLVLHSLRCHKSTIMDWWLINNLNRKHEKKLKTKAFTESYNRNKKDYGQNGLEVKSENSYNIYVMPNIIISNVMMKFKPLLKNSFCIFQWVAWWSCTVRDMEPPKRWQNLANTSSDQRATSHQC